MWMKKKTTTNDGDGECAKADLQPTGEGSPSETGAPVLVVFSNEANRISECPEPIMA